MKVDDSVPQPFSPALPRLNSDPAPSLLLMHATFVLCGLGTMLLGPILPVLAAHWQLKDSQLGLLLMAQFVGSTIGGMTISPRLERDLKVGLVTAFAGLFAFANAPSLLWSCPALLVGGFGVGRTITAINIIAGGRFSTNRGSGLARLNSTWSFGALLSPLLAAWLLPHFALRTLLMVFATCFLLCGFQLLSSEEDTAAMSAKAAAETPLPRRLFVYFAALIFLYGGIETCLSGWLTTYALRYGKTSLVLSEYTLVLLLFGFVVGRALASWLLLRMADVTLQRIAIILSVMLIGALALAHQAVLIAVIAVLLGIALAPIFPVTFAILMGYRPPARVAGTVLATSGLGAAGLSWLMGVISTGTNSLQLALALPVAAAFALLIMTSFLPRTQDATP